MSNAMKKLKLLHHITAATTTTTTTTLSPAQAPLHNTLPTSPTSPSYLHHHYQRFQLLRPQTLSARSPPPPPPPPPPPAPKYQLPAGFMVLTPAAAAASESTNLQGLCVPASPPMPIPHSSTSPQQPQPHQLQRQQSIYSSRPPVSQHHQRRPKFPQRLTSEAVSKIGKDSRLARWERVLGYVREQRKNTLPSSLITTAATVSCSAIETPTTPSKSWKHSVQERKRRLEELEMIEFKNRMLDMIDREEMDRRSLWSGGSAGTNGVDEFVWSEDEEDDVLPMPQAPPPIKVIPEEGLFEMEETTKPTTTGAGVLGWGQRIVEEMPMLCREAELEGGLGRLVGRRMSAAY